MKDLVKLAFLECKEKKLKQHFSGSKKPAPMLFSKKFLKRGQAVRDVILLDINVEENTWKMCDIWTTKETEAVFVEKVTNIRTTSPLFNIR